MPRGAIKERYGPDAYLVSGYDTYTPMATKYLTRQLWKLRIVGYEQLVIRTMLEYRYSCAGRIPSMLLIGQETGISDRHMQRVIHSLEDNRFIVVTRSRGRADQIDLAPLLARIHELMQQEAREERSRARKQKTARPAQAASAAARPRSASAHQAPRPAAPARIEASAADANWWAEHAAMLSDAEQEQEEAAPVRIEAPAAPPMERSAAPSMEQADQAGPIEASAPRSIDAPAAQEQPAAPALPAECSAVLVAFLDAQHIRQEKELPALVAFVQQQRGPLNDTGLLVALERAREAATRDIEADQRGPHRIRTSFGLFKHKISEAIAQELQQRETAARRAAEQEQEEAGLLAGLNENGQRFYAFGKGLDWPIFRYGRLWGGADDWLQFASANQEDKGALYAALASIKEADQGEQAGPIEAPAAPAQEQEEIAPARIEDATSSPDLPAEQEAPIVPARIEVLRPPRFWQLAGALNYPHAELIADDLETEIVLDGLDSWQQFRESSSSAEQRRSEITLGKMERGRIASTGTRPAGRYHVGERPAIEADRPAIEAPASTGAGQARPGSVSNLRREVEKMAARKGNPTVSIGTRKIAGPGWQNFRKHAAPEDLSAALAALAALPDVPMIARLANWSKDSAAGLL